MTLFGLKTLLIWLKKQASCELYGLLKRPDEKFVTERAYDNPKFVEDMVRDVCRAVKCRKNALLLIRLRVKTLKVFIIIVRMR